MEKRVIILGSTGSIGRAALDVIESLGPPYRVVGLAANQSCDLLAQQAARFKLSFVAITDSAHATTLRAAVPSGTRVLTGGDCLTDLLDEGDANFVLAAIVGAAGLPATLKAVDRGLDVALANKESLVIAGSLLMPLARARGSAIIPVDSEHSAIFQALQSGRREDVKRVYLTASGGPFRNWSREQMEAATVADALKHPTWSMGPKITIDSATMMNKALEIVEAHHLFGLDPEQIEVLVHPESIVHSMVEYVDGSIIAQLGTPDMKTPIQYAFTYPRRCNGITRPLDWQNLRSLNFSPPDVERFPALELGFEAARRGGTCGAVLNAANEAAVQRFREGTLAFGQISKVTQDALRRHAFIEQPTLDELLESDAWARHEVSECIHS